MIDQIRQFLIGSPLPTEAAAHERLGKVQALALLSSDALSSVAYATEEILLVLVVAGSGALHYTLPIAVAITALLLIVVSSYFQTIHAYPTGGGAYLVTKDNLGTIASLTAGAALLIAYILTVAVSVSAGIAAITSAFPGAERYRVWLALGSLALVTIVNMRGVRETGRVFAAPTYFFMLSIAALVIVGFYRILTGSLAATGVAGTVIPQDTMASLTFFLILRAFSSGCTALTGVEAISDGVTVFRKPEADNAGKTLLWMGGLLGTMFLGLTLLANRLGIVPQEDQTVVSQMARAVFGDGPLYYAVQAATVLILLLAANTSFSDFPRLANFLAKDRFLPEQFTHIGDRLVLGSGIQALAIAAGGLIVLFGAETHALIPLYAAGVFISFTLSQVGMIFRWRKLRPPRWKRSAVFNTIGATTTGIVFVVVTATKFVQGAWITLVLIALSVVLFRRIRHHYESVDAQLSLDKAWPQRMSRHTVIVPIESVHRGVVKALHYAQAIRGDLRVVTVAVDADQTAEVQRRWKKLFPAIPLEILASPYRAVIEPLVDYMDTFVREEGDYVTVVLPEFVAAHWWQGLLHNQVARALRIALYDPRRQWADRYHVITGVRFFLKR